MQITIKGYESFDLLFVLTLDQPTINNSIPLKLPFLKRLFHFNFSMNKLVLIQDFVPAVVDFLQFNLAELVLQLPVLTVSFHILQANQGLRQSRYIDR